MRKPNIVPVKGICVKTGRLVVAAHVGVSSLIHVKDVLLRQNLNTRTIEARNAHNLPHYYVSAQLHRQRRLDSVPDHHLLNYNITYVCISRVLSGTYK